MHWGILPRFDLRGRAVAYDRVPQIPDPKPIAVAQLVGAGFKPALYPSPRSVAGLQARLAERADSAGATRPAPRL